MLKANVVPIQKLIDASKTHVLVTHMRLSCSKLFKTHFGAIEGGVPIKELNVGSMAHSTGKTS